MKKSHHPVKRCNTSDLALVAGFVDPLRELGYRETKVLAQRLRCRMVAVNAWVTTDERLSHKAVADQVGIAKRTLSYQFVDLNALYAFPPPELAHSLSSATAGATDWEDVAAATVPVFAALNTNPQGRTLIAGLARLHRSHPDLDDTTDISPTRYVTPSPRNDRPTPWPSSGSSPTDSEPPSTTGSTTANPTSNSSPNASPTSSKDPSNRPTSP